MAELRFRQVHLDFHTSEKIPGVGARFDAAQFQAMLQQGHVDSITLFSKCHHGLTYHDTKVGVRHPHLTTDLLPQQIAACRAIDVKTPIYISAGLDEAMLQQHPEWGVKGKEGQTFAPLKAGFKVLCFNTPYLDYLCAQIEEVVEMFEGGDGIFLDIIAARRCYCQWCLASMLDAGCDPTDDAAVAEYGDWVLQQYYQRTTAACRKRNPELRVFHNSGHIPKGAPDLIRWNSHLELESLPTGGWGYDHFPISAKYAVTTGYDFLGMTGKFHTTWGEFGGFKRAAALRYECAAMLAFGSKCSVGDQLHPSGAMNPDTYALIGAAYSEVAAREAWAHGAKPVSEVAIISPEALDRSNGGQGRAYPAEEGAARMLLETHVQFDVVDLQQDLTPYRLVILPDEITLSGDFALKIAAYWQAGGKLLLSGTSGMKAGHNAFALDLPLTIVGHSEWNPDYIIPGDQLPTAPVRGPLVMHGGAWDVRATGNLETLAHRADPYFNRAFDHFCSHQHTPDVGQSEFPAVVGNSQFVYFAHNIFTRYRLYGQPLYRDLIADAVRYLLGDLSVATTLTTAGRVSLMHQPAEARYILHLLYATPSLRGGSSGEYAQAVEVIEDLVPLHDVACALRLPATPQSIQLVPSGEALAWTHDDHGVTRFTVPHLLCHQMVEIR